MNSLIQFQRSYGSATLSLTGSVILLGLPIDFLRLLGLLIGSVLKMVLQ